MGPSLRVLMLCNDLLDHQQVQNHFIHKHTFVKWRAQECGYDRQVGLFKSSRLGFMLLRDASSKMIPSSSVLSGKRLCNQQT